MEQNLNDKPLSNMQITRYIESLKKEMNFDDEVYGLVKSDLEDGLTQEQTEKYLDKNFNIGLLNGSYSETDNQATTVQMIMAIRLLFNIYTVFKNQEIAAIASEAGAATFGIGTVVVYMLYLIAEPMLDTVILANGGSVELKKDIAYLTPTGIVSLIGKLTTLKLNDTQKNDIYTQAVDISGAQGLNPTYSPSEANKIVDALNSINYTQMLIIIMLFSNSNALINRLADVIQMEASYNAATRIDSYVFDLDKSFTYLRASGSFSTNEFIKLSNASKIYSKERIVYRGY